MALKTTRRPPASRSKSKTDRKAKTVADIVDFEPDPCDPENKATRRSVRTLLIALAVGVVVVIILFSFVPWSTRP